VIVTPHASFSRMEGLGRAMIFLDVLIMVPGELLMGWFKWCPSPCS
jgi:hypothetical protein